MVNNVIENNNKNKVKNRKRIRWEENNKMKEKYTYNKFYQPLT